MKIKEVKSRSYIIRQCCSWSFILQN